MLSNGVDHELLGCRVEAGRRRQGEGALGDLLGVGAADAEDAFSQFFMRVSPEMFPAIFKVAGSARGLFEKIPSIHQSFPAAASCSDYREKVHIVESTPQRLVLEYDSPNRLCRTLRTVAGYVLDFYEEKGRVYETACAKDGAERCRVVVEFDD